LIKNKYIVVLIFFVVIIIANQIIVQLEVNRQSSDPKTINTAGKQRLYSQQITNIALRIKYAENELIQKKDLLILEKITDTFFRANTFLRNINLTNYKRTSIDSLFEISEPYFNNIITSSKEYIRNPKSAVSLNSFIKAIEENESQFLNSMDVVVTEYQYISDQRLTILKKVQLFFITFTSVSLIVMFVFIFLPLFRKNKALTFLNLELKRFKAEVKKKDKEKKNVQQILERTNSIARIGTWEVDWKKNTVNWSKVTKEIHQVDENFKPSFETGINFYKEGYNRNKIQEVIEYATKNNTSYDIELEIVTAKNKTNWVRVIGETEFKNNKCSRVYGIFQDINERKLQQLKLNQVNEELKAIFNSGPISIIRTDKKGVVTHFNKGAELLLQYKSEEIIGKQLPCNLHNKAEILTRAKELKELYGQELSGLDTLTAIAKREGFESRRWTYFRKNGSSFPVQLIVTAIKNTNGGIIAFLRVGTDITEIVEKENKLINTKNNLEIVTEKLINQNKQLANFAHITSHNLRAPISNLTSLLGLYNIAENKEEEELIFSKFRTVIHHLSSTLNVLVEAIKIKEKKISDLKIEELKFIDFFYKTKELLSGDILKMSAKLIYDFSAIESIKYNKPYLESIFINLISNALRYSSLEREIIIDIKTRIKKGKIQLLISDNGLGIDLEKNGHKLFGLNKVFHRHKDSKGVGLYIVKNQIESLGGSISCVSKSNIGSTFKVTF
jgi:PAS domain S-box-containing protein